MCLRSWCRSCATRWPGISSSRSRRVAYRAVCHPATVTRVEDWNSHAPEPNSWGTCPAPRPGSFRWWPSAAPGASLRRRKWWRWLLPERRGLRGRQCGFAPANAAPSQEGIQPHPDAAAPQKQQHQRGRQHNPQLEPIPDNRAVVDRLDPVAATIGDLHDTAGSRVYLDFIVVLKRRFRDAPIGPDVEPLDVLPAPNRHVGMLVLFDGSQNIAELDDRRLRRSPMFHRLHPGPVLLHLKKEAAPNQEEQGQGDDGRAPVMEFSVQDIGGHLCC